MIMINNDITNDNTISHSTNIKDNAALTLCRFFKIEGPDAVIVEDDAR